MHAQHLDRASERLRKSPPVSVWASRKPRLIDEEPQQITAKEMTVLFGIARGRTQMEICGDLGVSIATVKTHTSHLLSKSKSHTHTELVSWAYRFGYMDGLKPEGRPVMKFTPREMSIIQLSVLGMNSDEMAIRLIVSAGTIKTYMVRIRSKMQARNRAHLVALMWQLDLVDLAWWDELGVVEPTPLRRLIPAPAGYTGRMKACPTCGTQTKAAPGVVTKAWHQDAIW